jgi:hypothetical protein
MAFPGFFGLDEVILSAVDRRTFDTLILGRSWQPRALSLLFAASSALPATCVSIHKLDIREL